MAKRHFVFANALLFLALIQMADQVGILSTPLAYFAAVFSPFIFIFFVYTIYRIWVKEKKGSALVYRHLLVLLLHDSLCASKAGA